MLKLWDYLPVNLVLCDPPYDSGLYETALKRLVHIGALAENALICVESRKNEQTLNNYAFTILDSRTYGNTNIHFYRFLGQDSPSSK